MSQIGQHAEAHTYGENGVKFCWHLMCETQKLLNSQLGWFTFDDEESKNVKSGC